MSLGYTESCPPNLGANQESNTGHDQDAWPKGSPLYRQPRSISAMGVTLSTIVQ